MAGDQQRPPAYRAATYEVGSAGVTLSAVTFAEAQHLGAALAAIEPWSRYPVPAATLSGLLAPSADGGIRLAARRGNDPFPLGVMVIRQPWLVGPYLQFLAVVPGAQGQGLGHALLDWFETEARAHRIRNLWICASAFNERALRLYRACGFEPVVVLDDLIQPGIDEILMRKRITPSGS